jgi:hypothetical protein
MSTLLRLVALNLDPQKAVHHSLLEVLETMFLAVDLVVVAGPQLLSGRATVLFWQPLMGVGAVV